MLTLRLRAAARPDRPLAVPVTEGAAIPAPYVAAAGAGGFTGAAGQSLRVTDPPALLLGVGAPTAMGFEAAGALAAALLSDHARAALDARGRPPWAVAALATGAGMRAHRVDHLRSAPSPGLDRLDLWVDDPKGCAPALRRAEAALAGANLARTLAAEPGNILTPRTFTRRLRALEKEGIAVRVYDRGDLRRMGAGGLLAVGSGSAEPPRLVVLRWNGRGGRPVALVGKGITFDTGGISIKPAGGMEAMKADMAGAAACAGAMLALARRNSPAAVTAVLAIAENATGAASYRPGDVLRTLSGRTVEVVDTDAEGRLVLADALTFARSLRPRAILDLATLTGSIVTALGHHRAGLFGNDDALRDAVLAAGEAVGEPLWPMPIGNRHREDLASDIADLRHCLPAGGGGPGWMGRFLPDACHAAAFLRDFAAPEDEPPIPWAHLDIAAMDLRTEDDEAGPYPLPPGPSGFGARLLDRLVEARFERA